VQPPRESQGPLVACESCGWRRPLEELTAFWERARPWRIGHVCRPSTGEMCFSRAVSDAMWIAIAPATDPRAWDIPA
jgi:hypothetical protein